MGDRFAWRHLVADRERLLDLYPVAPDRHPVDDVAPLRAGKRSKRLHLDRWRLVHHRLERTVDTRRERSLELGVVAVSRTPAADDDGIGVVVAVKRDGMGEG